MHMFYLFRIITRGFYNADFIGRVHKKFCKSVSNVKSSTNSFAMYGELGRFPLFIERHIQIVKYFLKLHQTKNENCILYCVLIDQRKTIDSRINVINWSSEVRNLLQNAGFGDVWLFPDSVNFKLCIPVLRHIHNTMERGYVTLFVIILF